MAVGTPTNILNFGDSVDRTTYTTGTVSPAANMKLYMFVSCGHASAATAPTSIGGTLGLTWTQLKTGVTISTTTIRGTLYEADTTGSPPSGTISATFGTTHSNCQISITQVPNAGATIQSEVFPTTTTDNPSADLPNAIGSGNATIGWGVWNSTSDLPVGSGYTALSNSPTSTSPTISHHVEYKIAGSQTVDWTTTSNVTKVLFSVEVADVTTTRVTKTATASYDVRARGTKSATLSFNVGGRVTTNRTLSFDARFRDTTNRTLSFNALFRTATLDKTLSFNVGGRVTTNRTLSFDARQRDSAGFTLSYDAHERNSKSADLAYDARFRGTRDRTLSYNALFRDGLDATLSFDARFRDTRTGTITFDVEVDGSARVTLHATLAYDTISRGTKSADLTYDVRNRVDSPNYDLTYHVRFRDTRDGEISFDIWERGEVVGTLSFDARQRGSTSRTASFAVRGRGTKDVTLSYNTMSDLILSATGWWFSDGVTMFEVDEIREA